MTTRWYQTQRGIDRLNEERRAVADFFPGRFQECWDPDSGEVYFEGKLTSNTGRNYDVVIILPDDYPYSFARPYITSPEFVATARRGHETHIYTDSGMLCLHYPGDSRDAFDNWVVHMIAWVAEYLYNWENLCAGGTWLSPEAPFNG